MRRNLAAKIFYLIAVLFLAGCASYQSRWNARVGTYTYDQALVELGPPDKRAQLTDNQIVAEWISRYSTGGTVGVATDFYGRPIGGSFMQSAPVYRESKLRLIFNTNNILTAWMRD